VAGERSVVDHGEPKAANPCRRSLPLTRDDAVACVLILFVVY
jgi:hypothetical protein